MGNNLFAPQGNLTGGQALTLAARIHAIYKYGSDSKLNDYKGEFWYSGPVAYCKAEGLIGNELDSKLNTNITRAEMLHAWAKILQSKDLVKNNLVASLPDVSQSVSVK
jgi:hypothetical protein